MTAQADKPVMKQLKFEKAGNRSYEEVLKIIESVEKELKDHPELAEKIDTTPHERVF